MKISDSRLAGVLGAILDGRSSVKVIPSISSQAYEIDVSVDVYDNHRGDSPDAILRLLLTIRHPALPKMKVDIHIPVEGEVAGIAAAKEDLRKFAEREHFPLRLPMLVIGGVGNPAHSSDEVSLKAKIDIEMIPYRQVSRSSA